MSVDPRMQAIEAAYDVFAKDEHARGYREGLERAAQILKESPNGMIAFAAIRTEAASAPTDPRET